MVALKSLLDLPPLHGLSDVCSRFGVTFEAFGGVVTRIVRNLDEAGNFEASFDLFSATPFTADIDLLHSGPSELTPQIVDAILSIVPAAECFRWEVRSSRANGVFSEAMLTNNFIPARLITLSTDPGMGLRDPWSGRKDIQENRYRYIRNGYYERSPLFQSGRDVEFFSALIYVQTLLEADLDSEQMKTQPGLADVKAVFEDAQNLQTLAALQESAYLRSRFGYLYGNVLAAARSQEVLDIVLNEFGLGNTINRYWAFLGNLVLLGWPDSIPHALVSSARLGGDIYRMGQTTQAWHDEQDARSIFLGLTKDEIEFELGNLTEAERTARQAFLPQRQRVLFASPGMRVIPGISSSSQIQLDSSISTSAEFLHFALIVSNDILISNLDETDLSAILAVRPVNETRWIFLAVPTTVTMHPFRDKLGVSTVRLMIRMNCLDILRQAAGVSSKLSREAQTWAEAKVFVVTWSDLE
ncbi:hypothetical protein [Candidatus Phyllobacterium onerii]|uniref:hypothetical protein n=1 Tax=Candidatus Phyllobacterium onerii TaxID=3020828 RepID=UPI00232E7559|nr:hypothetical protein [Phyllobacterium sp. IY22]